MPGSRQPGFVLIDVEDDEQLAWLPITDDLLLRLNVLRDEADLQTVRSAPGAQKWGNER
jgi:hypothetical protein